MAFRIVYERPERRRAAVPRWLGPGVALALAAAVIGVWACAPRPVAPPAAAAPLVRTAEAAPAPPAAAAPPAAPSPPPVQTPAPALARVEQELKRAVADAETEAPAARAPERELEAVRRAEFPVRDRMEMSSTAYCLKGSMRTGVRTRDGMAAADPRVIPLGSVIRLSHPDGRRIGIFVVMDTGGAIRGNKVDIYMDSCREATNWGRRPVVAEILDIGRS